MKPLLLLLLLTPLSMAHENDPHRGVFPAHEHAIAQRLKAEGPQESQGILAVVSRGSISLTDEFPGSDGRVLRVREITLAPGGVVAVHQHEARPGVAYILEGEFTEHRNDSPTPLVRSAGAVSFEQTGVIHWWENSGNTNARALVVDIVPE